MNCDCINEVSKTLAEKDLELELVFQLPAMNAAIPVYTKWIDGKKKRKKPTTIIASFCPFCGKKTTKE